MLNCVECRLAWAAWELDSENCSRWSALSSLRWNLSTSPFLSTVFSFARIRPRFLEDSISLLRSSTWSRNSSRASRQYAVTGFGAGGISGVGNDGPGRTGVNAVEAGSDVDSPAKMDSIMATSCLRSLTVSGASWTWIHSDLTFETVLPTVTANSARPTMLAAAPTVSIASE